MLHSEYLAFTINFWICLLIISIRMGLRLWIVHVLCQHLIKRSNGIEWVGNIGKLNISQRVQLDSEKTKIRVSNLLKSVGANARFNEELQTMYIPHEYIDYVIHNYNVIPRETIEKH